VGLFGNRADMAYALPMTRRAQQPITIRSDRAARRLALLTRDGRSQASVIEEALESMPLPNEAEVELRARIEAILDGVSPSATPSMAAFDARDYDEHGQPR
jgi:hypothetical protein